MVYHGLSDFPAGMETFFESFRSMGVASGSCNSSNQSLICSEVVTTSGQACRAAQRFVKAKNLLRTTRFRCDLFADASEVPCDVKDTQLPSVKKIQEIDYITSLSGMSRFFFSEISQQ